MLSFDSRIYSVHYDSPLTRVFDLHCNIMKFGPGGSLVADGDVRREAFAHPGMSTPPS